MATRGFFTILNNEENIDDPYIGYGNVFVESFHDGYLETMLDDILNIPKKLVKVSLFHEESWMFRKLDSFSDREFFNNIVMSVGVYNLTWDSLLHLLQLTTFNQYHRIDEGVRRYGHSFTSDDSDFTVLCDFKRLESNIRIELSEHNKKRLKDEEDEFYDRIKFDENGVFEFDLIKEFNNLLFEEIQKINK